MDPNATLRMWASAVARGDKYDANEAYNNLRVWIERGGFEPKWGGTLPTRAQFFSYSPRTGKFKNPHKKRRNLAPAEHVRRAWDAASNSRIHKSHPDTDVFYGKMAAHAQSVLDDPSATKVERRHASDIYTEAFKLRKKRESKNPRKRTMKKKRKLSSFNLRVRAYMKKHPHATLAKAAKACAKRKNGEQRPKDRAKFMVKIHAHKRRKARRNWEPVSVTAVMPRLTGKLRPRGSHAPKSPKLGKHAFTPTVARANPSTYTLRYYSRAGKLIGSQKARVKLATAKRAAKAHLGKSWLGRTIHKVVLSDGRK